MGLLSNSLNNNPHGVVRWSLVSAGTCVGILFVGEAFTKTKGAVVGREETLALSDSQDDLHCCRFGRCFVVFGVPRHRTEMLKKSPFTHKRRNQ